MTKKELQKLYKNLMKANTEAFYKRYCKLDDVTVEALFKLDHKNSNRLAEKLWRIR